MKITKIRDVITPTRGTSRSAGLDFYVPRDFGFKNLKPGERILIPSGIRANVPSGFALIAFNKSGVASKLGLGKMAEVVDEDYQGEIHISVVNTSNVSVRIESGQKIIQFVLIPINYALPIVVEENELYNETTERGEGGFGSTDRDHEK